MPAAADPAWQAALTASSAALRRVAGYVLPPALDRRVLDLGERKESLTPDERDELPAWVAGVHPGAVARTGRGRTRPPAGRGRHRAVSAFSEATRARVVARAGGRCEYCRLPTRGQVATLPHRPRPPPQRRRRDRRHQPRPLPPARQGPQVDGDGRPGPGHRPGRAVLPPAGGRVGRPFRVVGRGAGGTDRPDPRRPGHTRGGYGSTTPTWWPCGHCSANWVYSRK